MEPNTNTNTNIDKIQTILNESGKTNETLLTNLNECSTQLGNVESKLEEYIKKYKDLFENIQKLYDENIKYSEYFKNVHDKVTKITYKTDPAILDGYIQQLSGFSEALLGKFNTLKDILDKSKGTNTKGGSKKRKFIKKKHKSRRLRKK